MATSDGVYFLETNTLPGLTSSSLVPQELKVVGIEFRDFLLRQVELAVERSQQAQRQTA
jgi:D-alanine-D-alanine ligase